MSLIETDETVITNLSVNIGLSDELFRIPWWTVGDGECD